MQFAFTSEQRLIDETARGFFTEHATSARTRAAMAGDGIDRALWQGFAQELALAGVAIPEAFGGAGLGLVELAILAEAAGACAAALPLLSSLGMAAPALIAGGSEAQRAAWLPKLASGEAIGAFAHAERLHADGGALTGIARYIPHGAAADVFVIASGHTAWVLAADAANLRVEAHTTMDQTRPFATVHFEGARAEPLADGAAAIRAALDWGRVCVAADSLGGAQTCLDRTVDYSKQRVQFGRPISSFQAYKHRLADMMVEIEQARSAVYWAACAVDEDSADRALAVHSAKSFAADAYFMCAGNMIQLHGGIGFTWEHDAHLFFKRARAAQTMLGDGPWHREQIAKLMGLKEDAQ